MDFVNAMTGPNSLFNGPDRGGLDTLHGEHDGHWYAGYEEVNLTDSDQTNNAWLDVEVPTWQDNEESAFIGVQEPELPVLDTAFSQPDVWVVKGRFMVGAIKWPHEEYLEQYVAGAIAEITDAEKVPVYWLCDYRLFIPIDYGKTDAYNAVRRGKALIVTGNGGTRRTAEQLPPGQAQQLDGSNSDTVGFRYFAALQTARRLDVPVLVLESQPEPINTWKEADAQHPQGGVMGYHGEASPTSPLTGPSRRPKPTRCATTRSSCSRPRTSAPAPSSTVSSLPAPARRAPPTGPSGTRSPTTTARATRTCST